MKAMRKIQTVDEKGILHIEIPKEFGSEVEVIILPIHGRMEECPDRTDEEWNKLGLYSLFNTEDDKDIDWEEAFGVKF